MEQTPQTPLHTIISPFKCESEEEEHRDSHREVGHECCESADPESKNPVSKIHKNYSYLISCVTEVVTL